MFKFDFEKFHDWYSENLDDPEIFENDKNIAIYMIERSNKYKNMSKKLIKKKQLEPISNSDQGYLEAFMKTRLENIAQFKSFQTDKYKNGLYCVVDDKGVYVVFPTEKDSILCADHITFVQDNVHKTTYTPSPLNKNIGRISHIPKSILLDGTELPLSGYAIDVFKKMNIYKEDILDICRLPELKQGAGQLSLSVSKPNKKPEIPKKPDISPLLERLLIFNEIKTLKIYCIKSGDSYHVTTMGETEYTHYNNIYFTVKNKNWPTIHKELCKLLKNTMYLLD
jgi:hypothetical protein